MNTLQSIGERIRLQRTQKHKTQRDICDAIHIEQVTLSQYETNKRTPKLEILIALADLFDVSVDYLLGRIDTPKYSFTSSSPNFAPFSEKTNVMIRAFEELDLDNQDIMIGEIKKLLKQQRLEEKREARPIAKAT